MTNVKSLPFENRWANGETALHWYRELERMGIENVRVEFLQRQTHTTAELDPVIPAPFVQAWLRYHDRRRDAHLRLWLCLLTLAVGLTAIAAIIAAVPVMRAW